jgi:hypothetical protein
MMMPWPYIIYSSLPFQVATRESLTLNGSTSVGAANDSTRTDVGSYPHTPEMLGSKTVSLQMPSPVLTLYSCTGWVFHWTGILIALLYLTHVTRTSPKSPLRLSVPHHVLVTCSAIRAQRRVY